MEQGDFRIYTHKGKAHMDEVVAAALLCIYKEKIPAEVHRLDNREIEQLIEDQTLGSNDWVLDCGLHLNPDKRLFDHHQSRDMDSTALLVFHQFFSDLEGSKLHEAIKLISRVDTRGLQSLNDFDLLDESMTYFSFSQKLLLKGFEMDPMETLRMATEVLKDMMDFEVSCRSASEWLNKDGHIAIVEMEGVKVLHYLDRPPLELVQPLRAVDKKLVDEEDIDAVYSFDDKNPDERSLFRTLHGHDRLDFSKSSPKHSLFCHAAGFLLKFIPAEEQEWKTLILQSIV